MRVVQILKSPERLTSRRAAFTLHCIAIAIFSIVILIKPSDLSALSRSWPTCKYLQQQIQPLNNVHLHRHRRDNWHSSRPSSPYTMFVVRPCSATGCWCCSWLFSNDVQQTWTPPVFACRWYTSLSVDGPVPFNNWTSPQRVTAAIILPPNCRPAPLQLHNALYCLVPVDVGR